MKRTSTQDTYASSPVQVNGIAFESRTDRVWRIPPISDKTGTPINLALRITNRAQTAFRFCRLDTVRIGIVDADGKALAFDGGRNGTAPGDPWTQLLLPQDTLEISRRARLVWLDNGTLRLVGSDDFGGIWYLDGLKPGKYTLQITHENNRSQIGEMRPIWTGMAATSHIGFVLR